MNSIVATMIGLTLAYTAFCRARVMTLATERAIRYLFAFAGMCGLGLAGGELALVMMPTPDWWVTYRWHGVGVSFVATQFVTAKFWAQGVPAQFLKANRLIHRLHPCNFTGEKKC